MLLESLHDPSGRPTCLRMDSTMFSARLVYIQLMLAWRLGCYRLVLLVMVLKGAVVVLLCGSGACTAVKADEP